ncbi:MAG TPA: hypothetical protein VL551_30900 [Actinospica sp.]|jgi:hypothetical protein|nr:hypothetical protein [Actinospica sp.]
MRISPLNQLERARKTGVLVLGAALAISLAIPAGGAAAAVTPATAKTASSAPATASTTAAKTAPKAAPDPKTMSYTKKTVTKPTAPVTAQHATALAPAAARQARAAAAHSAITHADVPDTCSGAITSDTVYPCSTPSSTGTDTFTLTLADSTDLLLIRALSTSGNTLGITVTDPSSNTVSCSSTDLVQCPTTAAGTYTLQVQNQSSDYTLDYTALLSDTSCATADPSFATGVLQGSVADGQTGACYTLNMASGDVLHADLASSSTEFGQMNTTVYDATGTRICVDDQGDCTLTGTAPYRVRVGDLYGRADTYWQTLYDITDPQGCSAVAQQTYGTVPDQSSADQCRTLTVTTAGSYQVYAVSSGYSGITGTLYNANGTAACTNSGSACQLAAGTYDFVTLEYPEYASDLGVVFIAANESRGCVTTGDTDFASGPATGTFAGLGEEVCLTLPTAAGASDYVFNEPSAAGASTPSVQLLDATGASACSIAYAYNTCALTGTGPFHEILSAQAATGAGYRLLTQRTDSTAGCAAWPQSAFGGSYGAQAKTTATAIVGCLSIPAAQHSVGEMIDYTNATNTADGAIYVNDPTGKQVCVGATTAVCSFKTGVAYTALVITVNQNGDTYDVVRRDVSSTANCASPASTAPGGASSPIVLSSDLYAACYRVSGATTDKWWFDARTLAPGTAGAVLEVTDPTGAIVCRQWNESCNVTGSTSYQAIVIASNYAGVSIAGHVDIWKVGTSAGWAAQCTAHQLSANGWAPLSATLTETSSAYCAEVAVKPLQNFRIVGTATGSGLSDPWVNMYTTADWTTNGGLGLCYGTNWGMFGFTCGTQSTDAAGEAVMLVTPYTAPTPVSLTIQGVCSLGCATPPGTPTISAVSPATGVAGLHDVVVTGTDLNLGTELALAGNGSTATVGSAVSVNSAGTSLTVQLNTTGVTPGKYDAVLTAVGQAVVSSGPGYLAGAYTVTPAPVVANSRFTPVNTTRILDTRKGLGAPKARVASDHAVTLKVAGVGGVPTSGATAVLVNVTSVSPTAGGNLEVYPDSEARPGTSTVNFGTGQTVANLAVVPLVDGKIDLYNDSPGQVDILADVSGYYTAAGTGSLLTTLTPTAILDTRTGLGAPKGKVASEATVALTVKGVGGVPASGATAALVDVTALNPTSTGNIEVYPDTLAAPGSSTLNFTAGKTVSNEAVVRLIDGKIDLHNDTLGTTDITVDVLGYFSASGSGFQPENTVRVLDTRTGLGGSGETVVPHGAAVLNVMNLPGVPPTVTAVVLNVTVTSTQQAGAVTVYADGDPLPAVPDYFFASGSTVAGLVTVPVVDGKVAFYNGSAGTVQVIADLAGYYLT